MTVYAGGGGGGGTFRMDVTKTNQHEIDVQQA